MTSDRHFSSALIAALILTVGLPRIGFLHDWDEKLRAFLQRRAAIPREVLNLAGRIRRVPASGADEEPMKSFLSEHSEFQTISIGNARDELEVAQEINSTTLLLARLEYLRSAPERHTEPALIAYLGNFLELYRDIRRGHERLREHCGLYVEAKNEFNRNSQTVKKLLQSLAKEAREVCQVVCEFVAGGVLGSYYKEESRRKILRWLGYDFRQRLNIPSLMHYGEITLLMIVIWTIFGCLLVASSSPSVTAGVIEALMITLMLTASTVVPMCSWERRTRHREAGTKRPYHRYVLLTFIAAVLSVGFATVIKLAQYWLNLEAKWTSYSDVFNDLLINLPYQLIVAAICFGLAFILDSRSPTHRSDSHSSTQWKGRLREGGLLAGFTALFAFAAWVWLSDNGVKDTGLVSLMSTGSLVGFIIGSWLPTSCRNAVEISRAIEGLTSANAEITERSIQRIKQLGSLSLAGLCDLLEDPESGVRLKALRALRSLDGVDRRGCAAVVESLLDDESEAVRVAADDLLQLVESGEEMALGMVVE